MEREHISIINEAEFHEVSKKLLEMGGKVEMMINNEKLLVPPGKVPAWNVSLGSTQFWAILRLP